MTDQYETQGCQVCALSANKYRNRHTAVCKPKIIYQVKASLCYFTEQSVDWELL